MGMGMDPFGDPFGDPMMGGDPFGPPGMGPGGWGGPVFEFNDDGSLEGDFFKPQNEFVFDPFGGPDGFGLPPEGFEDGMAPPGMEGFAAMGDFFQDFMGPEGEMGEPGMGPDGPGGLKAGAREFFNANSEGGFDPTM